MHTSTDVIGVENIMPFGLVDVGCFKPSSELQLNMEDVARTDINRRSARLVTKFPTISTYCVNLIKQIKFVVCSEDITDVAVKLQLV